MPLLAIQQELELCRAHIEAHELGAGPVAVFLARYLLVRAYAEFELAVQDLVRARGELITDTEMRSFYEGAGRPRDCTVSEMGKFLERFSEGKRSEFLAQTQVGGVHVRYSNVLNNRHLVAHDHGASVTFGDVEGWLIDATDVLDAFAQQLGVPPPR